MALKKWLVDSLRGEDDRERTHEPVFKSAGVSQGTFYKILKGNGGGIRQSQVSALAMALGVPAPMIDRVLRLPGDELYVAPLIPTKAPAVSSAAARGLHEKTRVSKRAGAGKKARRKLG